MVSNHPSTEIPDTEVHDDLPGLRILHVAECYEAGVGHAVDTIARVLETAEHLLLFSGEKRPSTKFSDTLQFGPGFLRRIRDVRAAVQTYNPDIVHLHSSWAGVYGRVAGLHTPIVYQPHCYKFDDPQLPRHKTILFQNAERLLGRLAKIVLALSPHEMTLANKVSPNAQCLMLPNAPSLPARGTSLTWPLEKKVVMVGRISPQKDPSFYIEVSRMVREHIPDARFTWIGEGDEGLTKHLRDHNVEVTGWLDETTLSNELDSASCYVHTAMYEGFPLSVLDAAARSLPIVTRKIPAFAGTGLIQGDSPGAVAQYVTDILSEAEQAEDAWLRSRLLLDNMNENKQREALLSAYRIALGESQ